MPSHILGGLIYVSYTAYDVCRVQTKNSTEENTTYLIYTPGLTSGSITFFPYKFLISLQTNKGVL